MNFPVNLEFSNQAIFPTCPISHDKNFNILKNYSAGKHE